MLPADAEEATSIAPKAHRSDSTNPAATPASVAQTRRLGVEAFTRLLPDSLCTMLRLHAAPRPATLRASPDIDTHIDRLGESLRQPLTAIRSLSEILQENPELPAEQQARMLGLIVDETKRLNRLIGQCLDLVAEATTANDRYNNRDRRGAA
jgi:signal transduction histidine kinase